MALSGTPNMIAHFAKADATFWNRCIKLPLGRLAPEEAVAALRLPLSKRGWSVEDVQAKALLREAVVQHAQCYPYFVQLLGEALVKREPEMGKPVLSRVTLEAALVDFGKAKDAYYGDRRAELRGRGLLKVAAELGRRFQGMREGSTVSTERTLELLADVVGSSLDARILGRFQREGYRRRAAAIAGRALEGFTGPLTPEEETSLGEVQGVEDAGVAMVYEALCDVGFLWTPIADGDVELGIPSMAGYLAEGVESAAPASALSKDS